MDFSFDSFVNGDFDFDISTKQNTGLWLRSENMDIGGGKISVEDIDILRNYPKTDVVTISGLNQKTFEYFITTYGKQLRAIRFFKNKLVEDWSLLGTLPQLEYIYFFANQRIEKLWDMSSNKALSGLGINDFSRLHSIENIQTAPALKFFQIGNAIWSTMRLESLMPLQETGIEEFSFCGKAIEDNNFSFLENMPKLKVFDFPSNMLSTEQVAWIVANFPSLSGFCLKPSIDITLFDDSLNKVPGKIIVGKRKPCLKIAGNEKRIDNYIKKFDALVSKYKGVSYKLVFSN